MRKLLKERLQQEDTSSRLLSSGGITGEELANNKDFIVTQAIIHNFRKPITNFDAALAPDQDMSTLVLPPE